MFGPFPWALWLVVFLRVRSVFSCAQLGSFACVRSISVRSEGRQVRSRAFGPFQFTLGIVQVTFDPFPCALSDRRVRSVHSRSPWL